MKRERISALLFEKSVKVFVKQSFASLAIPLWIVLAILAITGIGRCMLWTSPSFAHSLTPFSSPSSSPFDFGNQTIELDQVALHFTNGFYKSSDGQHVARFTDQNENQSVTRAAAILIDNPAGSGIFSYVIGATLTDGSTRYSAPIFLGDRIQIEAVNVGKETVTVHYLDHPANTPLGTPPAEPATVTYTFQDDGNLRVVP